MKLAIIAPTAIPSRRANTLQVMKMAQAFVNLGHDVRVVIPEDKRENEGGRRDWESLAYHYGVETRFPMEWLPANPSLRRYDFAWHAVRWSRNWGAEIIYTRLPQAAAFSAAEGYPTILEIHDLPQGTSGPILFKLCVRGRGARRMVVISNPLAADLQAEYGSLLRSPFLLVIPDGVDLERYSGLLEPVESRRLLISNLDIQADKLVVQFLPERFTVGYTGHLYPGRGISLILEIAKRLPEMNFLIVGGDPQDVGRVQRKATEANLRNVTITGFVPNADLPKYQSACDVLMMPYQRQVSASSGGNIAKYLSPMKLFEYMACGRAICSSDLPVFRDVLSSDLAILLPPDDANEWVAALEELHENPLRREELAKRVKSTAGDYSWENRARKILAGIQPAQIG
jgi:glycosyltransferase involved in cell wall biosynthesis